MPLFESIQQHIIGKLKTGLPPDLAYHNVPHTLDVIKQAEKIALEEGVKNEHELLLLKTSALYHDIGFIEIYNGHEERSCELAQPDLELFGFSTQDIDQIFGMIVATKVPQQPTDLLQQIICDSDLDYLGRHDFFTIGEGLYKEFIDQKIVTSFKEWNELQIRFLESHEYFTTTARKKRQQQKLAHLETIKQRLRVSAFLSVRL
jgi:hypothetical protein